MKGANYLGVVREAVYHRLSPEVVIQIEQTNGQLVSWQGVYSAQRWHVVLAPAQDMSN